MKWVKEWDGCVWENWIVGEKNGTYQNTLYTALSFQPKHGKYRLILCFHFCALLP